MEQKTRFDYNSLYYANNNNNSSMENLKDGKVTSRKEKEIDEKY